MKRFLASIALTLIAVTASAQSHSGHFTMSFNLSAQKTGEEVNLWIPYPVSDTNQYISNIRWEGNYRDAAVYTDQVFSTPMLHITWPGSATSRLLTLSFDAKRNEQRVAILDSEGVLNPAEHALYLAATSLGPVEGGVRQLADEITAGKKTILAKAQAIYDWTVENTFRDPETRGCGVGDVNKLLKRPGGKCADISSVFVAIARAAGVPAREIFGIRSGKEQSQDVTKWQHCWAEFFLPGTGWVPVDPADVRKAMLKQNLAIGDPQVKQLRDYFWGGVDPYRIRLSEGRDLELNPRHVGPPLNYLMYPFAQVGKTTLDWLDPESFSYRIEWQPLSD